MKIKIKKTNQKGFIQIFVGIFALLAAGGLFLIKYHGYEAYSSANPNMQPAITINQVWALKTVNEAFKRGDIIAFYIPQKDKYSNVARIVGLPGESIMLKGGKVYINNNQITESYLLEGVTTETGEGLKEGEAKLIPADQYAVLADNRSGGLDSRDYGFITKTGIIGKMAFCYKNCSGQRGVDDSSFKPDLQADRILNLVNQYRQSKKLEPWTSSNQICQLAGKRADYLVSSYGEPLKASPDEIQKKFEEQVKGYTGAISEIDVSGVTTNQGVLDFWKNNQNNFLLSNTRDNVKITKACVAVKTGRASSLVVLMVGSDPVSQTQVSVSNQSNLDYSEADTKAWGAEVSYINQDLSNLPKFLGNSSYDQGKLNQMSALLNQRKTIADKIYNKMINKQFLTSQDDQDIVTYNQITSQYDNIALQVFPRP